MFRETRSILWVNHFAVPPGSGGGTRHYELGRELQSLGWSVLVASSDFNYQSRSYMRRPSMEARAPVRESIDGVEFEWLWSAPYLRNDWRRAWNWLSFAREVRRWKPAGGERPGIIIGSSPHLFAALAASQLAGKLRVPFVLEVRDLWPESLLAAGGRRGPTYAAFAALARYLYRRADRILVLARGTGAFLNRNYGVDPARIVFVPNGVDPAAFAPAVERPERERFTLVYAGAHGPANGLDVVLSAAALLRERHDIRFLLVGDGPSKAALRERARSEQLVNVEFHDPVPKREMPRVLRDADAGLMVLRDSPLFAFGVSPNKLFDYLGAGLPVVCNVPGEVERLLRSAGAGEQAIDAGAAALADAVTTLAARSLEERRIMGERGRTWVAREHGRQPVAIRLDEALRGLVRP